MTEPAPRPLGVNARLRLRRDWAEDWEAHNPILRDGEPGYDKSTNRLKIGDGLTPWNELEYLAQTEGGQVVIDDSEIEALLQNHIRSRNPHPAYDDGPSLLLLYQNAKV